MRLMNALAIVSLTFLSLSAIAEGPSEEISKKVLSQGVPQDAWTRLSKFMYENSGRSFVQDTYTCEGKDPASVKPCEEKKRRRSSQTITLKNHTYAVIVDFTQASTTRRFFMINLKTGQVDKYYGAHGVGSGNSNYASRFSNTKDSRQTSLGIFATGETYIGSYGETLRMYGLQRSNDQAYNRDIVLHGAWYVGEDFISRINEKTKQPYGRIGHSWGCPAVSLPIAKKIIPILKGGALIMHYHSAIQDDAQSGKEVVVP